MGTKDLELYTGRQAGSFRVHWQYSGERLARAIQQLSPQYLPTHPALNIFCLLLHNYSFSFRDTVEASHWTCFLSGPQWVLIGNWREGKGCSQLVYSHQWPSKVVLYLRAAYAPLPKGQSVSWGHYLCTFLLLGPSSLTFHSPRPQIKSLGLLCYPLWFLYSQSTHL